MLENKKVGANPGSLRLYKNVLITQYLYIRLNLAFRASTEVRVTLWYCESLHVVFYR